MGWGVCSCSGVGLEVAVIVGLDEILGVFLEGRDGGGFPLVDLVESADVLGVEFVFLLSVPELDEGFAHFCFF